MVGPAAKREAVAHLRGVLEMSERRACTIVAADRKMIRYRSRRGLRDRWGRGPTPASSL
jgi:putative transposase